MISLIQKRCYPKKQLFFLAQMISFTILQPYDESKVRVTNRLSNIALISIKKLFKES